VAVVTMNALVVGGAIAVLGGSAAFSLHGWRWRRPVR
jgi:hypothetical protein